MEINVADLILRRRDGPLERIQGKVIVWCNTWCCELVVVGWSRHFRVILSSRDKRRNKSVLGILVARQGTKVNGHAGLGASLESALQQHGLIISLFRNRVLFRDRVHQSKGYLGDGSTGTRRI